ncbi:hypothetical protein [Rivularia sp. PCC 7116]|nr:hypothetical protein [Rivularia sp. PCC 7116]
MTQTTGLVRGGLVINKVFIDYKKIQESVNSNTSDATLDVQRYRSW